MQLKASVNGVPIATFSPVTTVNGVAKAVIFNPTELFNPGAYGLAAWPVMRTGWLMFSTDLFFVQLKAKTLLLPA